MASFTSCKGFFTCIRKYLADGQFIANCRPEPPRAASRRVLGPRDAVEDEIQPVFEFVTIVVAGLHGAVDGHLGEVGILVRPESLEDVSCDLGNSSSAF